MPDWITVREAAEILGLHMSAIPKMVHRGHLTRREQRPRMDRAEVEALRDRRAAIRASRKQPRTPQPPDDHHDWINAHEAAALMGVGPAAVRVRARRGRLPSERHDGRRWCRRDHLELVKQADAAKRRRQVCR